MLPVVYCVCVVLLLVVRLYRHRRHETVRSRGGEQPGCAKHGAVVTHALQNARLRDTRRVGAAGGVSAKADPGQCGIAADAGEAPAQCAGLRQTGARRLYGRESPARNPSRLLSWRQPVSSARTAGSVSGCRVTARPLGVRPSREHGPRVRSWKSAQPCETRVRGFHVRHDRPERHGSDPSSLE